MTSTRLRLVVLKGTVSADLDRIAEEGQAPLRSAFEVVEVENADQARRLVADAAPGTVLVAAELAPQVGAPDSTVSILEHVGEGLGVVDASGTLTWRNNRLGALDERTLESFVERCRRAIDLLNGAMNRDASTARRASRKFAFVSGEHTYELAVSPATVDPDGAGQVTSVVGVLIDVTGPRRLQQKIDAIDAAGSELMRMESASVSQLNMAERLRLLEEKIVRNVHDLLSFDNFEIRLLDRQTNRLELVVAVGLTPLKIGEVIFAESEGNGISGVVASSGESYICDDVRHDPHYRDGLDNAASSLTVPLRLHDEVIGVFNVESNTRHAFDDNDRQFTEIFCRYVAMAMHILDLLVVERYTTNEQVATNVLSELSTPIEEITRRAEAMSGREVTDPGALADLEHIRIAAREIRNRIEACKRGPRTILGADQELKRHEIDPIMVGRRVLVADNEPEILETMHRILEQRGCDVRACANGTDTLTAIEESHRAGEPYELIISDIKMHDHNGYEIFQAAKAVSDDTPVILMTGFGYDPHHSIIRASQDGLHSLLFKPFKASQLIDAMSRALGGEA